MRIAACLVVLAIAGTASCSSSGSSPGSAAAPSRGIGQPVAPSSSGPVASAALGSPITQGSLTITVSGPPTLEKDDTAELATFSVTMTNSSTTGDVVGPDAFGVRCDANRSDRIPGDEMSTTTVAGDKHIPAGQKLSGIAVLAWLKWNSVTKCTGPTTIEARFLNAGFLSWTLPADVVAKVNTAGGV